ncbi:MAG TPA: dihydroorotate dehydrogenase [Acidimicrobiales bacterium]|nr:dihydroorotate dehydrogenase [Acidimicrobiales bacterium]
MTGPGGRSGSVDLSTSVGTVGFANPVMTASGTAGHGAELARYMDLSSLGAVVVKSLSAEPWGGNPAPRVTEVDAGILNSVGLQNPGVEAWLEDELPALLATGARVVASIWGFTVEGYEKAATALADAPPAVVAVEVNLSCPNVEERRAMFAHSPSLTADAVEATAGCRRPRWAKLSPNVTDITEIAGAALRAGAEALTLVNTVMGMAIDVETRRYRLGAGGGGLSGPAIRPVAVRAVHDVCSSFPDAAVVGVGGVTTGEHAVELLLAGASAVQVGTATFADPRAPVRIRGELERWCRRHGVARLVDLVGKGRADT